MMYMRTVCVTSVLAHCTVIHSDYLKIGLLCFRPGLTQTDLYSHRRRLEPDICRRGDVLMVQRN